MDLSQLFQGKGTEFGLLNSFIILIYILHKIGVFKKIRFVVKISNRLNNNTVMKMKTPGNPNDLKTKVAILETGMETFKEQNQREHDKLDKKCDRIFELLDKRRGR